MARRPAQTRTAAKTKKTAPARGYAKATKSNGCDRIVRGYFGLGDHEAVIHVTSNSDFLVYIWARNVETFHGGVIVETSASQFRGSGSSGPFDALVLDVPAQTGLDLGCIGAQGGEVVDIGNAFSARLTVYLTVVTAKDAAAKMTWTEA
jgi:hypothetical protein